MVYFRNKVKRFLCDQDVLKRLIIINCVVFVLVFIINLFGVSSNQWIGLPSDFSDFLMRPWTIITYMFVQNDVLHILFNMLWLYCFAQVFLQTLNARQLLTLYILGGLVGGILYLIMSVLFIGEDVKHILVGSSASILSIMAATTLRSPNYKFNLFLFGEVKLKWIAIVLMILIFVGIWGNNQGGEIAHAGGVLTGLFFGIMLRRGTDVLKPIYSFVNLRKDKKRVIRTNSIEKTLNKRRQDIERLNGLLEKIKQSGYGSLTKNERDELESLSKKLS